MIRLTDEQPTPQNGLIGHTRELLNIFDKQKGLPKGFPSKLDLVPNPLPQSLKRGPNHKVSDQQLLVVFFAKMQIRLRRDQTHKREVPRLKSGAAVEHIGCAAPSHPGGIHPEGIIAWPPRSALACGWPRRAC
jgi:hypothetical protein